MNHFLKKVLTLGVELDSANGFHAMTVANDIELAYNSHVAELQRTAIPDCFAKINVNKYIQWYKIWNEEVDLQLSTDILDENRTETISIIQHFLNEENMSLLAGECELTSEGMLFVFGESGGQNESDCQGWSRNYTFTVDFDFMIINAKYEQG